MTRHERGLLDTSVIIRYEQRESASMLPRRPLISTITLAEISVGSLVAEGDDRVVRQARLQRVESDYEPLPFDADAARAFGRVATSLRRAGRKTSARTFDAMIAAVALANNLPLYTCNASDFRGIDGLEVIEVS